MLQWHYNAERTGEKEKINNRDVLKGIGIVNLTAFVIIARVK